MEEYLTATEASKALGLSKERMACYCREGRLKDCARKGRMWLIPRASFEAFKENRTHYKPGRPFRNKMLSVFWRENECPSQKKAIDILATRSPQWIPKIIKRSTADLYVRSGRTRLERIVRKNLIQGLYDPA